MADVLRWIVMAEGFFVLGTLSGLFARVWRYAIPTAATREVMLAGGLIVGAIIVDTHDRLGQPMTWRGPLAAFSMTLYLVALIQLYIWYRRPDGRQQRHAMIAAYLATRLLRAEGGAGAGPVERRLRTLRQRWRRR